MALSKAALTSSAPPHIARDGERAPTGRFDHPCRFLVPRLRHVDERHAGILTGELKRRGTPDAAPRPGYKRNLARKAPVLMRCHVLLLFVC